MPANDPEPRNPLYLLLLIAGGIFSINAVAYAIIPLIEQKAADAGQLPPPSAFRAALREHGGTWLLWELGFVIVLGIASMGLDRLRSLKKERSEATLPADQEKQPSPPLSHEG